MNLVLIAAAALAAQGTAEPPQPDLDWLAGYWLSCEDGVEVSETWSDRRGGVMLGMSITYGRQAFGWEQARIEAAPGAPAALAFVARPRGAAGETAFPLLRAAAGEVVFENPAHDFPQRVIYRREGDRLTGRVEGVQGGEAQAMEWHYVAAPLNARCPRG